MQIPIKTISQTHRQMCMVPTPVRSSPLMSARIVSYHTPRTHIYNIIVENAIKDLLTYTHIKIHHECVMLFFKDDYIIDRVLWTSWLLGGWLPICAWQPREGAKLVLCDNKQCFRAGGWQWPEKCVMLACALCICEGGRLSNSEHWALLLFAFFFRFESSATWPSWVIVFFFHSS